MAARWTVSEDGTKATRIDGIVVCHLPETKKKGSVMAEGFGIALPEHPSDNYWNGDRADLRNVARTTLAQGIWFRTEPGDTLRTFQEVADVYVPLRALPHIFVKRCLGSASDIEALRNEGWRILHIASFGSAYDLLVEKDGFKVPVPDDSPVGA